MTNEKKTATKTSITHVIALLALSFIASGTTLISPAIQKFIEAFPNVPTATIRLITTLPSVISMVVTIFVGTVVGTKVKYRTFAILGALCILVGGVGPFFIHTNWTIVLCFSALLGVGMGCFGIRNALIMRTIDPANSTRYLGYCNLAVNFCGILFSPVVGALAEIRWYNAFLIHSIALVALLLIIFFLKEPPEVETPVKADDTPVSKSKINPITFVFAFARLLSTLAIYPVFSAMASLVAVRGIGSAAIAGTAMSIYMIGGAVCNFFLGTIVKSFKKMLLPVSAFIVVVGMALILWVPNIVGVLIGTGLVGFGSIVFSCGLLVFSGRLSDATTVAKATTLIQASGQAGAFISGYFITAAYAIFRFGSEAESGFLGGMVTYALLAVLSFIFRNKVSPQLEEN